MADNWYTANFDNAPATVDRLGEDELLTWLAGEVEYMLQHRREYLMSLCYTLDLDEEDVRKALHPAAPRPPHENLARLLYRRQRRRAETKARYQPPTLDDDEAW